MTAPQRGPPAPLADVHLPFPVAQERIALVTQVRGSLIASSLNAARERGLFERYQEALERKHHAAIFESIAADWLPTDVGMAHYRAMDALGLTPGEVFDIGRGVADRVQGTVLATAARLAKSSGVTPWLPLSSLHRLWSRLFEGGGVAVYKVGPKEARIDIVRVPFAEFAYFRGAFRGLAAAGFEMFSNRVYVTELARFASPTTIVFRVAWV